MRRDATDEVATIGKVQFLHGSRGCRSGGHKREGQCALPGEVSSGAIKLAQPKGRDDADREVSRGHSSRAIDEGLNRLMNASESSENLIGQLRRKTVAAEGAGRISREVCWDGYSRSGAQQKAGFNGTAGYVNRTSGAVGGRSGSNPHLLPD